MRKMVWNAIFTKDNSRTDLKSPFVWVRALGAKSFKVPYDTTLTEMGMHRKVARLMALKMGFEPTTPFECGRIQDGYVWVIK